MNQPPPGHPDAVKLGCRCPVLDNHAGKGYAAKPGTYRIDEKCPLHAVESKPCAHDYERPVRKGRARYHCPKCGDDISLTVILIAEADWEAEEAKLRSKHRAGLL